MHWSSEKICLNVADGSRMNCYAVAPSAPTRLPGLILLQEAFGVNNHFENLAQRFSEAGFVTIVPELFHRTAAPGQTWGYGDFQVLAPHFSALTEKGILQDVQACFDWLRQEKGIQNIGTAGWCMGGRASFVANSGIDLKCAVSFYGGRIATQNLNLAAQQRSPLLMFWGGLDKNIPPEQIQEINKALRFAKKSLTCVEFSEADHGFFCDERPSYNAIAFRQSQALMLEFLKDYLPASV